ncbi:hypothetical protein ACHAPI_002021 [Fusarium lateritium]
MVVEDSDVIVEEVGGAHVVEVSEMLDDGSEIVVEEVHGADVAELCDVVEDEEIEEVVVSHEVVVVDVSLVLHVLESEVVQVEPTLVEVLASLDVQVLLEDSVIVVEGGQDAEVDPWEVDQDWDVEVIDVSDVHEVLAVTEEETVLEALDSDAEEVLV